MKSNATVIELELHRAGQDTDVPQLDLIIDTYVHSHPDTVAQRVADPLWFTQLWRQWKVVVAEDRGVEGVRWVLDDPRAVGSTEVWIEAHRDRSLLHTYVRVDPVGRPWPGWVAAVRRRRLRAYLTRMLWKLKDDVESSRGEGPPEPRGSH